MSDDNETASTEALSAPDQDTDDDIHDETAPDKDVLDEAARAIEAMVLVATDSVDEQMLAQLLELPLAVVRALCEGLSARYEEENRGFQFAEVAGGWRFQTHPDCAPYIERYVLEGQTVRLSSAALETLAIVAYKQPISRGQISAIRGVNVDGVLRTLVQRGYVLEIGRDDGIGQATLFGTTQEFLERLGLASLDDLPSLGDFVPSAEIVEVLEQTLRAENDAAIDLTEAAVSEEALPEEALPEEALPEHARPGDGASDPGPDASEAADAGAS